MTVPPIDRSDILRALSPAYVERGLAYYRAGRVRDLTVDEANGSLTAHVQGSERRPYRVEIAVTSGSRGVPLILGDCTCPVGLNCKHVAAVLFAALARGGVDPAPGSTTGSAPGSFIAAGIPSRAVPSVPPPPVDPLAGPVGDWLRQVTRAATPPAAAPKGEWLIYALEVRPFGIHGQTVVTAKVVRPRKSGGLAQVRQVSLATLSYTSAGYAAPEDVQIARLMAGSPRPYTESLPEDPDLADTVLRRLIATGRCHWQGKDGPVLRLGPSRPAALGWRLLADGRQVPAVETGSDAVVFLPGGALWYVDTAGDSAGAAAGPLEFPQPPAVVRAALLAPPVAPAQVPALSAFLEREGVALPPPRADIVEEIRDDPPVPCLHLSSHQIRMPAYSYSYARRGKAAEEMRFHDVAQVWFDYDGTAVGLSSGFQEEMRRVEGNRVIVRRRRRDAELAALQRVHGLGLVPFAQARPTGLPADRATLTLSDAESWLRLVHRDVPALRAEGWRVEIDPGFRHRVVDAGGDWDAEVSGEGGWWFSLDLGIEVDGQRVALLPILVDALSRLRDPADLDRLADGDVLYGRLPDGRRVALPFERVRALLATLIELFDAGALSADGRLDLSLGQALGLLEVEAAVRLRWLGGERLRALAHRLKDFHGIGAVPVPADLRAELRPYQHDGLNWLQFLRDFDLGGILADDMGLGKTVQTLAHVLAEKRAGRLDAPCLVVCPTSLIPNWRAEAQRFAPDLRVLALHGPARAAGFAEIPKSDLVLTTYPLLLRDADALLPVEWHLVVLDEAQAIKNPTAKATLLVCRLNARHRLCLTGTPVENHLGELWSEFAFLMPGLLGDHKRFTKLFRTPIEKKNDPERRALLAARVRPFILRRTKAQVAADLPAKTEIVQRIELAGDQRDLYETVRLAMHAKVRQAVADKGLSRSHIIILEALLKLRQACCDPRLVKLAAARKVKSSAKLEHLMEMLPELVEDGRRILLFSQFTSMLDLIRAEVDAAGIPYAELRGDTVDRASPVARFQAGEMPLFLISLKAGGTGLNLTAADTVIHYDPWWNPAVEDQATDRAHRIGQDKPVFVYKLIAEGTIEERMLELQERKRTLAEGLFDPERAGKAAFDPEDLELLFRPLE